MKESYGEGVACHTGPKSCVDVRKGEGEALTGVHTGPVLSREIVAPPRGGLLRGADAFEHSGRPHRKRRQGEALTDPARSLDPVHVWKHLAREPGDPTALCRAACGRAHREVARRTPMMNGCGKSDRLIVPAKLPNNAAHAAAEAVEGRGLTKGNSCKA
jgi:hypothetical protein